MRSKIFGIAGAILALMLAVSLVSVWKTRRVAAELNNIADHLVPITNRLTTLGTHVLEQEILLSRLFREYAEAIQDPERIDALLAEFAALGSEVDRELERALSVAASGTRGAPEEDDRLEFSRLQMQLATIERQHQEYHDLALRVLTLRDQGRDELAVELTRLLDREEADFDAAVSRASLGLRAFTEKSATEADINQSSLIQFILLLTGAGLVIGLLFSAWVTRGLMRPIRALLRGTAAVETGKLDEIVPVTTADEIGELTRSFNQMVEGLRIKERIKDTFGKYVDRRVVEELIAGEQDGNLTETDGEKQLVTVFFSDIAGFTGIGERLTPRGLVRLINGYLTLATRPIVERSGIIDKYVGDSVMAFWGPPFVREGQQARLACLAALESFTMLERFRQQLPELMELRIGLPEVDIRIGLSTGDVIVGNIGSDLSKSYTVMGDTVNLGSRLEGVNKVYGTRILICERTRELAGEAVCAREIDSIAVAGKHEPVRVFELLCRQGELSPDLAVVCEGYERGLAAYRERDWPAAREAFESCLAVRPEDRPARVLLERVERLREGPREPDWDAVWRLQTK